MKQESLNRILDVIRSVKLDGEFPPSKVTELNELNRYGTFDDILRGFYLNNIQFSIPNDKLYHLYDYVVPKNERVINRQFLNIPYLIAFLLSIYGVFIGNYWLLILIPVVIISLWLSSVFGGWIFYLIALFVTVYLFYSGIQTFAFISLTVLITIFFSHYLRVHRRNSLIKMALKNEEIFSFLFYSKTLSIVDLEINKVIYSGMRY